MSLKKALWGLNVVGKPGSHGENDIEFGVDVHGKAALRLGNTTVNEETIGGTGTTEDYDLIGNKPTINGVELIGDLESDDIGVVSKDDYESFVAGVTETLNSKADVSVIASHAELERELALKANKSNTVTTDTFIDGLSLKADKINVVTPSQLTTALATKANANNVVTPSDFDSALALKANKLETVSVDEYNEAINDITDRLGTAENDISSLKNIGVKMWVKKTVYDSTHLTDPIVGMGAIIKPVGEDSVLIQMECTMPMEEDENFALIGWYNDSIYGLRFIKLNYATDGSEISKIMYNINGERVTGEFGNLNIIQYYLINRQQ